MSVRSLALAFVLLALPAQSQSPPRDTLNIGITQYPSTLHPNIESMVAKSYTLGFTRRPVTAYDADWQLICMLCETLPTLENGLAVRETTPEGRPGLRVTWRLREGLKWGDGTPITTADLRFTYDAGREGTTGIGPAEFFRSAYEFIAADARSFTLRFDRVTFQFASLGDFAPLPAHLERARWESEPRTYRTRTLYDMEPTNPGLWNGPYRVAQVQPGSAITLERNAHWSGAAPAFRRIVIRTVESTPALEAQLLAGQVDMIAGELGLPVEQAAALIRRTGQRFRAEYRPGLIYEHLDLNLDIPALADRRVRQALLLALDRGQIVARLFEGRQTVAHTTVNTLDWPHDPNVRTWPVDQPRAAALLEEAGWRNTGAPDGIRRNAAGQRLSFDLMTTAGNRSREATQQVIQAQWRQVGVEARIRNEPPRVLFGETLSRRRFQGAALFAWVSAPESIPRSSLHSDEIPRLERNWSGQNYTGFRNAEMDALLEALPQELDREKRRLLWHRLQAIYAEELPSLPLWFRQDAHLWPAWLDGVRPTGHLNPSSLWVEEWRVR